jgi:exoribonuclease-2
VNVQFLSSGYFFSSILSILDFQKIFFASIFIMENIKQRIVLQNIARKSMIERGFNTDFPAEVIEELKEIGEEDIENNTTIRDMCNLIWCSIDNEDSLDLDQLQYAETLPENLVKILVAIADVDFHVKASSKIDRHARQNTTSIYTIAQLYPMLPEKLSTNLTSLNFNVDRAAIVVEMIVDEKGKVIQSDVFCAMVHNYAKLDYNTVGAWLEGIGPMPEEVRRVEGLAENIKLQDKVARNLRELRFERGALEFQNIESRPVFEGNFLKEIKENRKNSAKSMVEDFMITCNSITAQFLNSRNFPSLRRVVRIPKRWDRIVELAAEHNYMLSNEPDPKSLSLCFKFVKQNNPEQFANLTFSVLKLIGGGEYLLEMPGSAALGHFGLAVKDYSHSTAPNRRYPDLITHRLLKAAMNGSIVPYSTDELERIAKNCTVKEDDAKKVERQVEKSAFAMIMQSRIGEIFEGIVSGAAAKGTWIKLIQPNLEGKLVKGFETLQVGNKLKARLLNVNIESGFIDFERVE